MVKGEAVFTPYANACLPGITRDTVISLCKQHGIAIYEADLSLSQFINADGVFATGTMGELTPVIEIDGRQISKQNELMEKIRNIFSDSIRNLCEPLI